MTNEPRSGKGEASPPVTSLPPSANEFAEACSVWALTRLVGGRAAASARGSPSRGEPVVVDPRTGVRWREAFEPRYGDPPPPPAAAAADESLRAPPKPLAGDSFCDVPKLSLGESAALPAGLARSSISCSLLSLYPNPPPPPPVPWAPAPSPRRSPRADDGSTEPSSEACLDDAYAPNDVSLAVGPAYGRGSNLLGVPPISTALEADSDLRSAAAAAFGSAARRASPGF